MSSDILTVPEERNKFSFFLKDSNNEANISLFLQAICFFYTLFVVLYLQSSEGEYGQETPLYIHNMYIKPCTYLYIVVFSLIEIIPFVILHYIGTPRQTYPTSKTALDNAIVPTLGLNFVYVYNNSNHIYAIIGPIYYFRYYYYIVDSTESPETTLATIYFFAYILGFRYWLYFVTESFNCFLNMINIWKFTILQLRSQPGTMV